MRIPSFRSTVQATACCLTTFILTSDIASAQQDAPPVDVGQMLQTLRSMKAAQEAQSKSARQTAIQQISVAAGSGERAAAFWEDAVRATQMDGASKEGAKFREWKDGDGEALKDQEVQNAARLHMQWLALTLQRAAGAKVKDMLPAVIAHTKELLADDIAMDNLQEAIKREREQGERNPKRAQRSRDDAVTKKVHDNILNRPLTGSVIVQWLKLQDFIAAEHWEMNPGNLDGMYKSIILPEMRQQKDMRLFEYWDMKLKKEADTASKTKLSFEIDKFNNQRRPTLLWSRAQEFVVLGQKNRAVGEMFNVIKSFPTHPDADDWIDKLEQLLLPPTPATPPATSAAPVPSATPVAPAAPAPANSAPPVNVPGL